MFCSMLGFHVTFCLQEFAQVDVHLISDSIQPSDCMCEVIQFNCSVMSNSWCPHGLQHARLPCPSPIPAACSNTCPSSRWCHPTISCSVIPSTSYLQSCLASGSFPMSQFFTSGGQSIVASASASLLPMNIQD